MQEKDFIIMGSDHAGFELKENLKEYLLSKGFKIFDEGINSKEPCDYPLIAKSVAKKVAEKIYNKGILICGSGVGMSICANKIKGIRAVVCSDTTSARFSRLHNNSNILCLGQRIVGGYLAQDICDIWLNTEFEAQRHTARVNMIEEL
ncbi:MAG: ribose 5-phosphate isomerase B [Candidatus Gastranaerophilales bacterium]|nr:ribose 5-phosphate isomerase B [Candidatus Gastranaerophilales bacterium]